MAISKSLRFEILRRDKFTCKYCGASAGETELHVDHVIPESLGGTSTPENLVASCKDCNSGKSGRMLDEATVSETKRNAELWAEAMQLAVDEREEVLMEQDELRAWFVDEWRMWMPNVPMPVEALRVVPSYLKKGLPDVEICDAIEIAASAKIPDSARFKYFCGVCRNKLVAIQERALQIFEGRLKDES